MQLHHARTHTGKQKNITELHNSISKHSYT